MVETRLQGTTQAATPPFITPGDTSVDPWLERVQKALPDLKVRSQQALARLAQEDSWPELAHALVLAEEDINSPSSNSRVGFRPDVLVTCQGGNKMLQMLADALFSACVELQVSTCRVCCRGLLRRSRACLRGICRLNWHGLGRTNTPGAAGTGRPSIRPLTSSCPSSCSRPRAPRSVGFPTFSSTSRLSSAARMARWGTVRKARRNCCTQPLLSISGAPGMR